MKTDDAAELAQTLFEEIGDAAFVADPATLGLVDVNPMAQRMTGLPRRELLRLSLDQLVRSAAEPGLARLKRALHTTQTFHSQEGYSLRGGADKWLPVNLTLTRLHTERRPLGLVLARDISERVRAEEELRRANAELEGRVRERTAELARANEELEQRVRERTAELEVANKELEAFSYSVSHDLRAPLRAIDGYSRIVLRDYATEMPADAREYLDGVRRNAQQMGQLVDDLLALSRLGRRALRVRPVEMTDLVRECLDEVRPPAAAEIRVADLPPAQADPGLLKQVWLNLIGNALKYSGKRQHPVVEVGAGVGPDGPVYFVRDNGVGFDIRYAHKLFGVFQRLHRTEEYEGTGIGLALVQRIIHRHGGRVWAESEPDRGATFFFTLGPGEATGQVGTWRGDDSRV
jgi:PAS domain S-box-containing protein